MYLLLPLIIELNPNHSNVYPGLIVLICLVSRFSLECETYYTPDGGSQENIFQLPDSEKRNRIVDLIDIVKDNVSIS